MQHVRNTETEIQALTKNSLDMLAFFPRKAYYLNSKPPQTTCKILHNLLSNSTSMEDITIYIYNKICII